MEALQVFKVCESFDNKRPNWNGELESALYKSFRDFVLDYIPLDLKGSQDKP